MKIVDKKIKLSELKIMAENMFGNLVKAVVDIEKEIMAVDAELHADEERLLLEKGSSQANLWGINIYPGEKDERRIEFDSMINLRPSQNNRSRSVENPQIREEIIKITDNLIENDLPA